jgi:hypothetical protein
MVRSFCPCLTLRQSRLRLRSALGFWNAPYAHWSGEFSGSLVGVAMFAPRPILTYRGFRWSVGLRRITTRFVKRSAPRQILPPPHPLQFLPQHFKEPASRSHVTDQVAQLIFVELLSPSSAHRDYPFWVVKRLNTRIRSRGNVRPLLPVTVCRPVPLPKPSHKTATVFRRSTPANAGLPCSLSLCSQRRSR